MRNRRDNTYNYATPVKKIGFDKYVGMDEDIPEKEIRQQIDEMNDIKYMNDNEEKGILEGIIILFYYFYLEMDLSLENIKQRIYSVFSFIELNDRNILDSTDMIAPSLIFIFYLINLFLINKLILTYVYIVMLIGILFIYFTIKLIAKVKF